MSVPVKTPRGAKIIALASVAALLFAACDSDGPDASLVEIDAPAETAAPLESSESDDAAESEAPADEGETEEGESEAVPPNGETVDVVAIDNTFRVEDIEIVAGTEVHWENRGRNEHNVIPTDDDEDWGAETEDFLPGDEYAFVFDTPGEYRYYCTIHATKDVGMIGSVTVLPADG
ncbi:MAG: hypothetical protein DRJ50_05940 [Actinobacteria bacterium]|nr:MAG: hypothetical protein DRJ50_05940 [Actinomycetota bacterium]